MSDCPFCESADKIKENASAQALLSNPRKVPGHLVVMPKRHVEKPWELMSEELQDIFALIYFIEQRLVGKLGDGCDIRQNYRPFVAEGKVKRNHLHFHVVPRSNNDYLYTVSGQYESSLFAELDDAERTAVTKLLEDKQS